MKNASRLVLFEKHQFSLVLGLLLQSLKNTRRGYLASVPPHNWVRLNGRFKLFSVVIRLEGGPTTHPGDGRLAGSRWRPVSSGAPRLPVSRTNIW